MITKAPAITAFHIAGVVVLYLTSHGEKKSQIPARRLTHSSQGWALASAAIDKTPTMMASAQAFHSAAGFRAQGR